MKVTVYHNDARDSMWKGFVRKDAALLQVAEFDLDVELSPFAPADRTLEGIQAALSAQDDEILAILRGIYEQLNIGGDLVPATEYTEAYRAAGNRSLSVGDVVTLDGRTFAVGRFGFDKIMNAEARWAVIRYEKNADVETKMWRADNAAGNVDLFDSGELMAP